MSHHPSAVLKHCSICNEEFKPKQSGQNICSWECRQIANRNRARYTMRLRRHKERRFKPCSVCGYSLTSDRHHEGKRIYILCPNCHALITRGIKRIEQLFKERKLISP